MSSPVHFILGRAGGGKSRAIQERIVALLAAAPLGPPVYLLVPRQATFAHERHYALAAGLPGYARLRVVGFDDLGDDVLGECGGRALREVTPAGRQMLVGHLLRKNADRLTFFRGVARQVGLVREIDRTFAEFERGGRSSSDLLDLLDEDDERGAPPQLAALRAKARDLALLGDAYAKALGDDRLDATRRLERVLANLDRCTALRDAHLFVDGFYRMSAFERKFIAKLAKTVRQTTVALTLDPDHAVVRNADHEPGEDDLFNETATLYRKLAVALREAQVPVASPTLLRERPRFEKDLPDAAAAAAGPGPDPRLSPRRRERATALNPVGLIERDWSRPRPSQNVIPDTSGDVRLIEAHDARGEADAAARQVKDWVDAGLRLRECVVLCRDLPAQQAALEAAFREHGLTYFIDRRRPAGHHPLVRFVRSLLSVANNNWPHDAVMSLCKCGLAGMSLDDADALENYVLESRIRGRSAWTQREPWAYRALTQDDADGPPPLDERAERVEPLRVRLRDTVAPLTKLVKGDERPMREFLAALWQCVEAFDVPARLAEQIDAAAAAGELESAGEGRQAWEELVGLLDQADDLLGDEVVSGADFVATIEYGLDLLDLAIAPPRADEVIVGDVERTRVLGCRATVVVGLSDGTFPRPAVEQSVLGDDERRLLRDRGVDVEPDGRSVQLAERFLAYRAFTTPAEKLTLVRAAVDADGQATAASPYWEHVRTLLGLAVEAAPRDDCADASCLGTPRQLVTMLMRWARRPDAAPAGPAASLYNFVVTRDEANDVLAHVRDQAWPALSYDNAAELSPATVLELYGDALATSVSRLETFAACPFKHFAGHTLGLRGRDEDEVTPRDLGVVYHGVLERLIRHCLAERLDFADRDQWQSEDVVPKLTAEVGEALRGRIMMSGGRNRYLLDRVRRTLGEVVAGQQAALGFGAFEPFAAEVNFGAGDDARLPPLELTTPRGRVVRIHGQIDRVDRTRDGHSAMVIDYKLGRRAASAELSLFDVYYGLALQLLVYLLVLQEHGELLGAETDTIPTPVAALYVRLMRGIESCKDPSDAPAPGEEAFDLRVKPRGLIDRDHLPQLEGDFADGGHLVPHKSGVFAAHLTKDKDEDGQPVPAKSGDVVRQEEFTALLDHARGQVRELADCVLDGDIAVRPFRAGTRSPCSVCDYASVCRFDPRSDDYKFLDAMSRQEVLQQVTGEASEGEGE